MHNSLNHTTYVGIPHPMHCESPYTHANKLFNVNGTLLYTGIADLAQVKRFLKNVNNWQDLGLQLGLLQPTLKRIDKEQRGLINECKREMLEAWLQQQDNVAVIGVPCCDVLKEALEKIGEKQLASEINNL